MECFCNSLKLEELNYDENIGLHEVLEIYDKDIVINAKYLYQ